MKFILSKIKLLAAFVLSIILFSNSGCQKEEDTIIVRNASTNQSSSFSTIGASSSSNNSNSYLYLHDPLFSFSYQTTPINHYTDIDVDQNGTVDFKIVTVQSVLDSLIYPEASSGGNAYGARCFFMELHGENMSNVLVTDEQDSLMAIPFGQSFGVNYANQGKLFADDGYLYCMKYIDQSINSKLWYHGGVDNVQDFYIGFKFLIGSDIHYGYFLMKIIPGVVGALKIYVYEVAYQSMPNTPIW